jgi:hypothetical protein
MEHDRNCNDDEHANRGDLLEWVVFSSTHCSILDRRLLCRFGLCQQMSINVELLNYRLSKNRGCRHRRAAEREHDECNGQAQTP